jgi:hypothetical protein
LSKYAPVFSRKPREKSWSFEAASFTAVTPIRHQRKHGFDMLIQSQNQPTENKEDKGLNSVKCGQLRKNPQTIRKQNGEGKA